MLQIHFYRRKPSPQRIAQTAPRDDDMPGLCPKP